ncbi:MAG TPA: hypothetical protein G4N94_09480, partial [Caldilineae bacterium]|nr:hypothetical protein [Caldilineae bacterium]
MLASTFVLISAPALASVDLIYFSATAQETSILIEWETATELDNSAFFLYRSESHAGPWVQIYAIGAQGDSFTGAYYSFTDDDIEQGVLYWYQLEDLDVNDNSHFQDPISAGVNVRTPTPTSTPTPTATSSSTDPSPTATLEPTNTPSPTTVPTDTPTPAPTDTPTATFTPGPTATSSPTSAVSPTPTHTATPAFTATTEPTTVPATATPT